MAIRTDILDAISRTETREELSNIVYEFFRSQGFNAFIFAVPTGREPGDIAIYERGLPAEWVARYRDGKARISAVQRHADRATEMFRMSEVTESGTLTDEQRALLQSAREAGLTDGFVIPTHGRLLRNARFLLTCATSLEAIDNADRPLLEAAARQAHHRIDGFLASELEVPSLSPREVEILHWIGAGKTNAEIGTILAISPPTVATYVKRLFHKLDVGDRVSAAVKGLKLGLVHV